MKYPIRKTNPIFRAVSSALYDLPAPANLSMFWNFGSLLGLCWGVQVMTGLMLACYYCPNSELAFDSVIYIMRDVNYGWFMRSIHCNGASAFFICIYVHIARGIYYHSFFMKKTWWVGCLMLILLMGIAFSGYVLPWGQMSYWGATVILNLASAIPIIGTSLVEWVWGGYSVGDPTLKRLFVFHFLSPFILAVLIMVHIFYLHETGSNNPLGVDASADAVPFHSTYSLKDMLGFVVFFFLFFSLVLKNPDFFGDPVNYAPANPLKTPHMIQPEWYFLFAYAILRSIPNKLGGVVGLVASVAILYIMPLYKQGKFVGIQNNPVSQLIFWSFIGNFILLSYIGSCPVEEPYLFVGMASGAFYFLFFFLYPVSYLLWDYFYLSIVSDLSLKSVDSESLGLVRKLDKGKEGISESRFSFYSDYELSEKPFFLKDGLNSYSLNSSSIQPIVNSNDNDRSNEEEDVHELSLYSDYIFKFFEIFEFFILNYFPSMMNDDDWVDGA